MVKNTKFVDYADNVEAFSRKLEEPEWMLNLRLKALDKVDHLNPPVIERLRYNRWPLWTVPTLEENSQTVDFSQHIEAAEEGRNRIVQVGNQVVEDTLSDELKEKGVIFTDIQTALKEHSDLIEKAYMTKALQPDKNKITAHHGAFMNAGLFLYVPKNTEIDQVLEAIHIQNAQVKDSFIKHVLILADTNSKVNYVEKWLTAGEIENSANIIVEVIARDGASVNFSGVDLLGNNTTAYFNRIGHAERDASIDWALGVMNDGNVIADLDTNLVGDGSESDLKAVGLSWGKQTQAIDSNVVNYGKNSQGNIFQHGVILDRATLTFNGIGKIHKNGKNADAQQESRILMLSDKARGDANPILLIDEFEVTAGHAASVGRIDPEQLYYLMSRGIPRVEAERLAVRGFLGKVISAIPVKSTRDELVNTIERKLVSR